MEQSNENQGTQTANYDKFLEFRVAIIRAVAEAWQDEAYLKELQEDTKEAMKRRIGYQFPFKLDLSINVDNADWEPTTVVDWKVKIRNVLRIHLPDAPPLDEQPSALAQYNVDNITFMGRAFDKNTSN